MLLRTFVPAIQICHPEGPWVCFMRCLKAVSSSSPLPEELALSWLALLALLDWLLIPIFRDRPGPKSFTGFSVSFNQWDSFSVQLWECHTIFVLSSFFLSSPSVMRSQLLLKEGICRTPIYQSKMKPALKSLAFQRDPCSQSSSSSSCVTGSQAYHTSKGLGLSPAIEILILWATG